MKFKEAVKYNNRSLFVFYWISFQNIHPILETFYITNNKKLKRLQYLHFVLGFLMDFALTALFYTDKIISNYNSHGSDFWYNIPISIYTYIFISIINLLLNILMSSEAKLGKIEDLEDRKEPQIQIVKFHKSYSIRVICYLVIQSLLTFYSFIILLLSVAYM